MKPAILITMIFFLLQGCSSFGYYWEKIQGHTEILDKQQPVQEVIDNPETSVETRKRLVNTQQARDFASEVLLLPDNDSYRNYADIGRDYAVWTVVATPPYSVKPEQWCFLFVGCLSYRGYFSKQSAENFADELRKKNMDVYIAGTKAYSTLGWFDDPLLNTMLYKSEAYRVGIIFHELAHQQMYVEDDTAFNEAFASTVELEGIKLWFAKQDDPEKFAKYLIMKKRDQSFKKLLLQTRKDLEELYSTKLKTELMQIKKENIFIKLKSNYEKLKSRWNGYTGYDKWMAQKLNNAHLALVATYNDFIPAFSALYKASNSNFKKFYENVKFLKEQDIEQRHHRLLEYSAN